MTRPTTILIADDQAELRELLADLLRADNYHLRFAESGPEALMQAMAHQPDLLLLDVMLPGLDGLEVCRRLRSIPATAELPIVMVTALDDQEARVAGIDAGADDYIVKPFNRGELRARVRTITRLNRYRRLHEERGRFEQLFVRSPDGIAVVDADGVVQLANPAMVRLVHAGARRLDGRCLLELFPAEQQESSTILLTAARRQLAYAERREMTLLCDDGASKAVELHVAAFPWHDERAVQVIMRDISERKHTEQLIQSLNQELLQAYDATLEGWGKALDLRDHETEGHSRRVTELTVRLARALGVAEQEIVHLRRGALLHDIGKMGVPDHVLLKAGPLDEAEWALMRQHPVYAYEMLCNIAFLRPALDIPYCHHERWNGQGYPRQLRETNIPLAARIFAVVDVWDAMTTDRPYRRALSSEQVRRHLRAQAAIDFDPQVVDAFLALQRSTS